MATRQAPTIVQACLVAMFAEQASEGWPSNEGLRGLKPGETAAWDDWQELCDDDASTVPDGKYPCAHLGKMYRVTIEGTRFHIERKA